MPKGDNGYIRLYRNIMDWGWYLEPNTARLFIHCILKANYTEKEWQGIKIPAGSFVTSYDKLAQELKLSIQNIKTAIKHLKLTKELTVKSTRHYSIITVNNWYLYQINDQQNDRQEVQQTTTTNNIYKNNIVEINKKFTKPTIEEIKKYCLERGNSIDAEYFYNYYESKGWLVGKSKMKDFKAAIRTWEQNQQKYNKNNTNNQEEVDYASEPYRPF